MKYITVKEAAQKWSISVRAVQTMCKKGLIGGALKWECSWMIPSDAKRPADNRMRNVRQRNDDLPNLPMPKKCPILFMTNLYKEPGTADKCIEALSGTPEAAALLEAWFDYGRGNIDKVYDKAQYFLKAHSGFYAVVGAGMLLANCAMWRGDILLWREAKKHIFEAPCHDDEQREELSMWIAATDCSVFDTSAFPLWFKLGRFTEMPPDSLPVARLFYIKQLFVQAGDLAMGRIKLADINKLGLMRTLPYIVEPMISHAKLEKMIVIEIYSRLLCAIAYHNIGDRENAVFHIDHALALALPDKLYSPLVEHRRSLDNLLDERIAVFDKNALKTIKSMHKIMISGQVKLYNDLNNTFVTTALSTRELEVARLAAFGFSNSDIAERLHISINSVKSAITMALNKLGVDKRTSLGAYIYF